MRKVIYFIRKSQRNNIFYILFGIQVILILAYIFTSRGLEKPAGLIEAGKFAFFSPDQYLISILLGILAWLISAGLITSVFRELPFLKGILDEDDGRVYIDYMNYEYLDDIPRNKYIINAILSLISLILNCVLLKFLSSLLLLILIIMGVFIIYAKLSSY